MSWKMLEKPKTMLATKALVQEFVDMEPAPHDRPVSERRLMAYRKILKAGEFRPVTWASVHCHETNCVYRVNGKHTSLLLAEYINGNLTLPDFHVTVERYRCDTLTDVGSLYNTFDSRLASRSTTDINLAFAATIPQLKDVPKNHISLTVTAAAFKRWGEHYMTHTNPAERAEELVDCWPFALWLGEIITNSTTAGNASLSGNLSPFMNRAPVAMAMMATYDRTPNKAKEFWIEVRDESNPDMGSPTRVLARFISRASLHGGSNNVARNRHKKVVDKREFYVKCIHAWNAWRRGETTNLNYRPDKPLPDVVK